MDESNTEESRWQRFVAQGAAAQAAADEVLLFHRIRNCLTRWAARYAESEHAKKAVVETRDLIREIDEWIAKR